MSEPFTASDDTAVVMSRELHQSLERDSGGRLSEDWGEVFKWMDLCAAISATKHAKTGKLVTAQVDDMRITGPLLYGDMLTVHAQGMPSPASGLHSPPWVVNNAWNTSMEVEIRLEAENLLEERSDKRVICNSYFTFVAVKDSSGTSKLPKLIPSNPQAEQRFYEAIERRQIRFKRRELINSTSKHLEDRLQLVCELNPNGIEVQENQHLEEEIGDDKRTRKLMAESSIVSCMLVLPPNANHYGNTFGGQVYHLVSSDSF